MPSARSTRKRPGGPVARSGSAWDKNAARPRKSLWDRFWAKVAIPMTDDATQRCWLWKGAKTRRRRKGAMPHIRDDNGRGGKVLIATRVVLEWNKGPAPTPLHEAGHTCPDGEESLCVNPAHLEWQTRTENEQWKQEQTRLRHQREDQAWATAQALAQATQPALNELLT